MAAADQHGQGNNLAMNTDYHLVHHPPRILPADGTGPRTRTTPTTEIEIGHRGTVVVPIGRILTLIFPVIAGEGTSDLQGKIVVGEMIEKIEDMIGTAAKGIMRIEPEPVAHAAAVDHQGTVIAIGKCTVGRTA